MPEQEVKIVSWPQDSARLSHSFEEESPPVKIFFQESPAHVVVSTEKGSELDVNMQMGVTVKDTIPVCIKLCEPICAESDYRIGIDVFDRPVANISIRGLTRLFNCRETPSVRECVDFKAYPPGQEFPNPVTVSGVRFTGVSGPTRTVSYGEPAGQTKLGFNDKGIKIDFPGPVKDVSVVVSNYGAPDLSVEALNGSAVVEQQNVHIANAAERVNLQSAPVTAVVIAGGSNEASVVEVCFTQVKKR